MIILDIETASQSDEQLALVKPEFAPAANLRDPEKIKASVAEKEAAWREKAALSPLTGKILAIGTMERHDDEEQEPGIFHEAEPAMLAMTWGLWNEGHRFIGFNVKFDFRFLAFRSWALGVKVPEDLMEGRYFNRRIVCLQEIVTFYSKEISGFSLAATCAAFGLPGKLPGMTGADFARVFAEDRERALAYLRADLAATAALAQRLGIQ